MSFGVEVFSERDYVGETTARIAEAFPENGSVVLTGGTTAEKIYGSLATVLPDWSGVDVYFSDERCVPPDDANSNYRMAHRLLVATVGVRAVHRMRGEDPPDAAADAYHEEVSPAVDAGFDVVLLGMGADCHICAMFPASAALDEQNRLCLAVDRPDGLTGLTLTPPALRSGREILLIVTGESKAEAVRRAVRGDETPDSCPARLLDDHGNATFLLDAPAASLL